MRAANQQLDARLKHKLVNYYSLYWRGLFFALGIAVDAEGCKGLSVLKVAMVRGPRLVCVDDLFRI